MTVTARVIAHSASPHAKPICTLQLRYPKFIHGELLTHRQLSRNSSSSRAIPVERLIQDVLDDPVVPSFSGANKPGMQAGEPLSEEERTYLTAEWLRGRAYAVERARRMALAGAAKQDVNRIIEPYAHINTVVTSTEWNNFFALRRHPDAQPEIRMLAGAIFSAMAASTPMLLNPGQWHLPYVDILGDDILAVSNVLEPWQLVAVKLSVARCARVSYLTHEGKKPGAEADLKLYSRLLGSVPLHASPAEHQATPDKRGEGTQQWVNREKHGNFDGWVQYRKTLPGECAA